MKISRLKFLSIIEKQFLFLFPLSVVLFSPSKYLLGIMSLPDIYTYTQFAIFLIYLYFKKIIIINKYILLFIILIIFSFISLWINDLDFFFQKFKYQLRWYNYFTVFLITINYSSHKNFKYFVKGLYLATYLVCIYGIIQTIFIKEFLQTIYWIDDFPNYILDSFRTYSTFDNPLNLCAFLAFPLGFLQYKQTKKKHEKILLFLIYSTLILTASKIALILILITLFIYLKKYYKIFIYSSVVIVLAVLSFNYNSQLNSLYKSSRIYERISNKSTLSTSINQRFDLMSISIEFIQSNPILGIGYDNFEKNYRSTSKIALSENIYTSENFFLDFYLDNGLIPFLIIFIFCMLPITTYLVTKKVENKILTFPLILYLLCGLIMSARSTPLLFLFFYFLAIYFKLRENNFFNVKT